jgi:hypothetical protein
MKTTKGSIRLILLLLTGALLFAVWSFAQENPPARVARLSYVSGQVSLQPSGQNDWSDAPLNYTLTTGDRLYTDQNSRAELEVGPYAVRLWDGTDLTLANLDDQTMQLGLAQGSLRVSVYELPSDNTVEIDTPNGALTLLAPGTYRVDVDPNAGTSVVTVNTGSLQITGGGANQEVDAGQAVQLSGSESIQVDSIDMPAPDDFDQWSEERDRFIEDSASARYVGRYMPGYDALDQYGSWQTVPQYGPVWYPGNVGPGWVPYRDGYWGWVQPWGWTWVESEPWGFAPFHYGRWAMSGGRWGWVPGPANIQPVYSPAMVAFVGGGGFSIGVRIGGAGLAAWFPLGPRDPYIPPYRYSGNYLRQVNITNVRNVTNITNITNVTNIRNVNYTYKNVATTAVPANVFSGGQPVANRVVRVTPQQLAKAQVMARPAVARPVGRAAVLGGKPAPAPRIQASAARVAAARVAVLPRRPGARPVARGTGRPALIARKAPPAAARGAGRPAVVVTRNVPAARKRTSPPAPASRAAARPAAAARPVPAGRPPAVRTAPPTRAARPPARVERAPARPPERRTPPPAREVRRPAPVERAPARAPERRTPPPAREVRRPAPVERAPARGGAARPPAARRQAPPPRNERAKPNTERGRQQQEKPEKRKNDH